MNVLIAADMEGIAGIDHYGECLPSHRTEYARGRRLMTDETLVAIDALREAGIGGTITVGDWHMVGTNVERERMPDGVRVRPIADLALEETEPSFAKANGGPLDAVVMIGHHACTTSRRAFCSHTFVWEMEVLIDGEPLSETQVYAQALAAEEVPILACAGDRWMLEDLDEGELGSARLVATKEGQGRARARSHGLAATRSQIAAAIGEALASPLQPPPRREYPAEVTIRSEGEELSREMISDPGELLTAVATTFRTSRVSKDYRQLAKVLPAGEGSVLRGLQRGVGSVLATPVMRSKERAWLAAAAS
ncbi:MAG TPA: M55 family metallopeptidase [Solirubrobacterales bacterium]